MNPEFDFRVVLIKIQDSLSDCDRKQLHFLFSNDIPRRLQSDGSLETSLEVLQTLCDRLKISSDNVDYLIKGLKAIRLQQAKAVVDIGNLRVRICEDDQTMDTLLNNHVIVSTPQKFVNCLKKETMHS